MEKAHHLTEDSAAVKRSVRLVIIEQLDSDAKVIAAKAPDPLFQGSPSAITPVASAVPFSVLGSERAALQA